MAFLTYPSTTEVTLVLSSQEEAILKVVRGCPWWTRADIAGRVPGSNIVTGVTLTTTLAMDSTLRRILQMSFGLVFPKDGGEGQAPVHAAPAAGSAKKASRR